MSAHIKSALSAAAAVLCAAGLAATATAATAAPAHARQPAHATAYVANTAGNRVTAIDTTAGKVIKTIKVGRRPGAIAITPEGKTAYVATCLGVVPVNTATNTAGPVIKGTKGAGYIAITPNGKTAYITYVKSEPRCSPSPTANRVTAVDTATNTVIKQIAWKRGSGWGTSPTVISPDSKTAYVASPAGTLTPLRTATNTLGKPIKLGFSAEAGYLYLAITPGGKTVYVAWGGPNATRGHVVPVRTATARVLRKIRVGKSPTGIVMSPDGKTTYVASSGEGIRACVQRTACEGTAAGYKTDRPAWVTPISTATNTAGKWIRLGSTAEPAAGVAQNGQIMAITPNGKRLYIAYTRLFETASYVVPIRTATGTALPKILTAPGLNSVAITPDGKTAYVTLDRRGRKGDDIYGKVIPINIATNTVRPTIGAGLRPATIAITPR